MLTIRTYEKICILLHRRESLKRNVAQNEAFKLAQDFFTSAKKERKHNHKWLSKKIASSYEKFDPSAEGNTQILSEKNPQF